MSKGTDGSGLTPSGEAAPTPGVDFVREGQMYTWYKRGTETRSIKLRNKRVIVGCNGETWYLFFKALVSVKERQIQVTKLALSREAGEALHLLMTCFLAPDKFGFMASPASPATEREPEQKKEGNPPVTAGEERKIG